MKPKFIRQDNNKLKCLGNKWRKPKGLHSKLRNQFRGHRSIVGVGWKREKSLRGLISKLQNRMVYSLRDLENINPQTQGITISNSLGLKKRIMIINKAKERSIRILNIKNPDEYIAKKVSEREELKKDKVSEVKETDVAKEEAEKPISEKSADTSKEELDKLLTKRV